MKFCEALLRVDGILQVQRALVNVYIEQLAKLTK